MAPLTQAQAEDLVAWAGSKAAAAREIGVGRSVIRRWLDPEAWASYRASYGREERKRDPEKVRARWRRWAASDGGREYLRARERARWRAMPDADRELKRARDRAHYHDLSGLEYNALLLRGRRHQALKRMAQREEQRAAA